MQFGIPATGNRFLSVGINVKKSGITTKLPLILPIVMLILVVGPGAMPSAQAKQRHQPDNTVVVAVRASALTLHQASVRVKRETGGRILSSRTVHKNGTAIHRIKVLMPSGKVRIFNINANSGR